jgi:hypothetical protein
MSRPRIGRFSQRRADLARGRELARRMADKPAQRHNSAINANGGPSRKEHAMERNDTSTKAFFQKQRRQRLVTPGG